MELGSISILGSGCLLALAALRAKRPSRPLVGAVVFCLSFLVAVALIRFGLRTTGLVSTAASQRLVLHNASQLHALNPWPRNVIIIEGGSFAARGVNGEKLREHLQARGYDVAVLQFSLAGGNHFERAWLLEEFVSGLTRKERHALQRSHVVVMEEIQYDYDRLPLAQYERNRYTNRAYTYLKPSIAWASYRAVESSGRSLTSLEGESMVRSLVGHALVNGANVGALWRMRPKTEVDPLPGFSPLARTRKQVNLKRLHTLIRVLEEDRMAPAKELEWIATMKEPHLQDLFQGIADRWVRFAVANLDTRAAAYVAATCQRHKDQPCLSYLDPSLLRSLDDAAYWYDYGHLTTGGASI